MQRLLLISLPFFKFFDSGLFVIFYIWFCDWKIRIRKQWYGREGPKVEVLLTKEKALPDSLNMADCREENKMKNQ